MLNMAKKSSDCPQKLLEQPGGLVGAKEPSPEAGTEPCNRLRQKGFSMESAFKEPEN